MARVDDEATIRRDDVDDLVGDRDEPAGVALADRLQPVEVAGEEEATWASGSRPCRLTMTARRSGAPSRTLIAVSIAVSPDPTRTTVAPGASDGIQERSHGLGTCQGAAGSGRPPTASHEGAGLPWASTTASYAAASPWRRWTTKRPSAGTTSTTSSATVASRPGWRRLIASSRSRR